MVKRKSGRIVGQTMFGTPAWKGNAFAGALRVAKGTTRIIGSGTKNFAFTRKEAKGVIGRATGKGTKLKKWAEENKATSPKWKVKYGKAPKQKESIYQ